MLERVSTSRHNAMRGNITRLPHPASTNYYEGQDAEDERPGKKPRLTDNASSTTLHKHSSVIPEVADSDDDGQSQLSLLPAPQDRKTDLESALPFIKSDNQAIADYEANRASQEVVDSDTASARLNIRKWVRGKSSIYVDAFNLALETVLQDESHLFSETERAVFEAWRNLNYEGQYLYVRLFLRKASTWHRVSRLGYHGDIADLNSAIDTLKLARTLPEHDSSLLKSALESSLSNSFTFADDSEVDITSLEEASSLLLLDELKAIAKEAKVQGKNKGELLQALRHSSGRQTGLGFLKRSETEESAASVEHDDAQPQRQDNRDLHYVQKILAETGPCIRLSDATRKLFERIHLVFYRSTEWTEKSLTTIILARIARWTFPHYLVSRSASIFASRALLLEFENSIKLQFRVDSILEFNGPPGKGELEEILDTSDRILPRWRELLAEEQQKEDSIYATGEGAYLRRLSPAWVYTRIIHKGAFVLGKFKHHKREHEILVELLEQKLFHTSRRGDWYQRKALLEEHYLYALNPDQGRTIDAQKKHYKRVALATCEAGVQDRLVHVIYHHDLQKRIVKLEKALKVPKRQQHDFGHVRLAKAIERTFEGVQIIRKDTSRPSTPSENKSTNGALPSFYRSNSNPSTPRRSTKTVWLDPAISQDDATNEQQTCSVESMCLSRYRALGYKGYHCEGGILKTLFGYLLFDILFLYIPNVFQTEYQTCPLDLHTDAFYPSRLSEINTRLNEISNGEARTLLRRVWDDHHEKRTCVVGLDWDYEIEDLEAICDCFPGAALATLLKVLAQEYGQRGGGIPDLFLWKEMELDMADEGNQMSVLDPSSGKTAKGHVMFSEVKSENDRLSDTQRLWIDIIAGTGVRVEKCNALAKEVRIVG